MRKKIGIKYISAIVGVLASTLTILSLFVFVSPKFELAVIILLSSVFIFVFSGSYLVLKHTRRSLLFGAGITLLLTIRYLELDSVLNILLIVGILITIEAYFWKGK